jgi:hypothetical protein
MPVRNVFNTKELTAAIEEVKRPASFLYDTLVGAEQTHRTIKFEIHNKNAKRIRSTFVGRRDPIKNVLKDSFNVDEFAPPAIKLKVVNLAEDMFEQHFGQTVYDDGAAAARKELGDELKELKDITFRTKLWALAQLVTTGIHPLADGTQGLQYSQNWAPTQLAGGDLWSDPDADIIGQLRAQKLLIQKNTGIVVDTLIVSPDVADLLNANTGIKDILKQVNNPLGIVMDNIAQAPNGGDLIMTIPSLAIKVYTYAEWTTPDENTAEQPLLAPGTVILARRGSFTAHYGAMALKPDRKADRATLFVAKEVVRSWTTDETEDNELQIFSAPLIIPDSANGWACLKVIV